jgi:hypothetical protein
MLNAEIKEAAIQDALSQVPGAELLVNYTEEAKLTTIPLLFISFFSLSYEVQGTAAKSVVGYQDLK